MLMSKAKRGYIEILEDKAGSFVLMKNADYKAMNRQAKVIVYNDNTKTQSKPMLLQNLLRFREWYVIPGREWHG